MTQLESHERTRPRAVDAHPSPEELVAYRSGDLSDGEEEQIQAHLVDCEECAALLLGWVEFESPEHGETVAPSELEAAWQKQSELLFPPERSRGFSWWASRLVAAGLVCAVAWMTFEVRSLRRQLADVYTSDLPRVIAQESGERNLFKKDLPDLHLEEGRPAIVILLLQESRGFLALKADIYSKSGSILSTRENLSTSDDLVLLALDPSSLPEGELKIILSGLRHESYEPIGEYSLSAVRR